uniref:Uncharacterized protein n=1 Tax=Odontella aurita TaxID=265563 RepID=A0A6U6LD50_9STRA|mmetsp:Transcript_7761/g.22825  ORF Transcript_7761/g.22825 Transcript_7761/m.22825 type:complete len:126 (+) Transcript_7761:83-460(+)
MEGPPISSDDRVGTPPATVGFRHCPAQRNPPKKKNPGLMTHWENDGGGGRRTFRVWGEGSLVGSAPRCRDSESYSQCHSGKRECGRRGIRLPAFAVGRQGNRERRRESFIRREVAALSEIVGSKS